MSDSCRLQHRKDETLSLRSADEVMNLTRLGKLHPFRLSFMRTLVRRMSRESWSIQRTRFDLDANGFGTALYEIRSPNHLYTFVVFSHDVDPELRSDRVIANQWDMTVTLCEDTVDREQLEMLQKNVPLQEEGRVDSRSIVLSRANKSVRNFEYVVNELAAGRQPAAENIARVGYLYRTTAVYGSGKFGMADWDKVRSKYSDLSRPFAAEMLSCYMIREFSLDQAEYLAEQRAPRSAVFLRNDIKRYFGIGNATGLGMAPFLINHPTLISRWLEVRETALARIVQHTEPTIPCMDRLVELVHRAEQHLTEIATDNSSQHAQNTLTASELRSAAEWLREQPPADWHDLVEHSKSLWNIETQEILNALLIELHPQLVDDLEDDLCVDADRPLIAEQRLDELIKSIEDRYAWALSVDFASPTSHGVFWYRSKEKMEPRLGRTGVDAGEEKAIAIDIAFQVRQLYDAAYRVATDKADIRVGEFAIRHPRLRNTIRRVQNLALTRYGDIHVNLMDADVLPIHLLRCKLSFFGVSKFDPKSKLWVRNTMFQGAPTRSDLSESGSDDWCFPIMPTRNSVRESPK